MHNWNHFNSTNRNQAKKVETLVTLSNIKCHAIRARLSESRVPIAVENRGWTALAMGFTFIAVSVAAPSFPFAADSIDPQLSALLKNRCVKCHGPGKQEAKLSLSSPSDIARGGKTGGLVAPHDLQASLLWRQVEQDEMPPDEPLTRGEKELIKKWIISGAPGLPAPDSSDSIGGAHWAFQRLAVQDLPSPGKLPGEPRSGILDRHVQVKLQSQSATLTEMAPRATLIRRVSYLVTGLPPDPADVEQYSADPGPDAHARLVEQYLASPRYGERWGKIWLDAAGYADSNGYFGADTDRPLAFRYRDYVIRALNEDRPFDQFVQEQLAGDELAGFVPDQTATPRMIELLEATHFLRNGQDGTSESDGNPDELRVDRYTALESCQQGVVSSLLGLTIQCAKCHDHKFEPISQKDYYRLQAVFYPIFPAAHGDLWIKPINRAVYASLPGEQEQWEQQRTEAEQLATKQRSEFTKWVLENRPRGEVLFEDRFDASTLAERWSSTAPTDDTPGGKVPVRVDSDISPAARVQNGHLQIVEGGTDGDSWICTRNSFDWSPDKVGESIQVTFDLIRDRLDDAGSPAERIGYLVALHDFNDNSTVQGGNILIDGNPGGGTAVHFDYPGDDSLGRGTIGVTGYQPGRNYGIRITNAGKDEFRIEQLVDGMPEEPALTYYAVDLPAGGFGFEYCCRRSFIVDNVLIERFPALEADGDSERKRFRDEFAARRNLLDQVTKLATTLAQNRPGKIAWASAAMSDPPETHLLIRGNYAQPGEVMSPAGLSVLSDGEADLVMYATGSSIKSSGRRLAWARWVTQAGSRAASLLARVQVNRIWQHYFGAGIVATSDNLGQSGAPPTDQALLDWLAMEFIRSGWSLKHVHRLILNSATFCQSSGGPTDTSPSVPLAGFPTQRLVAESIRDGMLAISGDLDDQMGGPYVASKRNATGEVVIPEIQPGSHRRSIYLQQRRTQITSLLQVFDAPSIVFTSTRRAQSTMPLQSLTLLNADFVLARARSFANRLKEQNADESQRLEFAFHVAYARSPRGDEMQSAREFLDCQSIEYGSQPDARERAWRDFCHALLVSNEALYIE